MSEDKDIGLKSENKWRVGTCSFEFILQDANDRCKELMNQFRHLDTRASYLILIASVLMTIIVSQFVNFDKYSYAVQVLHVFFSSVTVIVFLCLVISVVLVLCSRKLEFPKINFDFLTEDNANANHMKLILTRIDATKKWFDSLVDMLGKKQKWFKFGIMFSTGLAVIVSMDLLMLSIGMIVG